MSWPAEARELLAELFGKEEEKKPEPEPKPSGTELREGLQAIRNHLRHVGAALAAGASSLLVGLGWTQLHNVFPAPASHQVLVPVVAFGASAAALIGVGWLTRNIFAAQRRIPMVSDAGRLGDLGSLNEREREIRQKVFESVAEEHEGASLRALELEARECERKAELEETPAGEKAMLKAKAARLDKAIDSAVAGAAMLILEERSGNVFRGWQSIAAFLLASVGIIVAFGVADYSKGQRDLISLKKSCAEAADAGVTDPCNSIVDVDTESSGSNAQGARPTAVVIGIRRRGPRCEASVQVDGKKTRAAKAGMAELTITDRARLCGIRLSGGALSVGSRVRYTGTTTSEVRLKPRSYPLVMLWIPRAGSTPTVREVRADPLVVAP